MMCFIFLRIYKCFRDKCCFSIQNHIVPENRIAKFLLHIYDLEEKNFRIKLIIIMFIRLDFF